MFTRLKNWLDLDKPEALAWEEWEEWHAATKKARPLAYFCSESIPSKIGFVTHKFVKDPINSTRYWIRVRLFDRYHIIRTKLPPGYHDCDERLLFGAFNMLIEYVENELPSVVMKFDPADEKKGKKHPWWSKGWTRFKSHTDPKMGLRHLRWEMSLGASSPEQSDKAREIWQLYHWWKFVRPLRLDAYEAAGWSEFYKNSELKDVFSNKRTKEQRDQEKELLRLVDEIEQAYNDEDEKMLIRLIKIRRHLWT